MLVELSVRNLGVVEELSLVLGPGLTAVTGETGAGKTMIVNAISLLAGGRAQGEMVRRGAAEAVVEGRFVIGEDEMVVTRVVPVSGRSRAYIDGRMVTAAQLSELAQRSVDLHGQHSHQSLLSTAVQRRLLDRYGGVDLGALTEAREKLAGIEQRLDDLGGDARARAHEIDLLRYQTEEIDGAGISDPEEDLRLEAEEDLLADATSHIEAAASARESLGGDGGVSDRLGEALVALAGKAPFVELHRRLAAVGGELEDIGAELRGLEESLEMDPERLEYVRRRRRLLHDLIRKYGDDLGEVVAFGVEAHRRLDELERHDEVAAELESELAAARAEVESRAREVATCRVNAAGPLGKEVTGRLVDLALAKASFEVRCSGPPPKDQVEFLFSANAGHDPLPLARVASGGELARVMLALRLVLTAGPDTLVFDEVDAGIGGQAALAVGESLCRLGAGHQVLVVSHLPQVAAFADRHVVVLKSDDGEGTVSSALVADDDARVVELARMLAGRPDSESGRTHATELLEMAAMVRTRRDRETSS